jgi:hypothetical protein
MRLPFFTAGNTPTVLLFLLVTSSVIPLWIIVRSRYITTWHSPIKLRLQSTVLPVIHTNWHWPHCIMPLHFADCETCSATELSLCKQFTYLYSKLLLSRLVSPGFRIPPKCSVLGLSQKVGGKTWSIAVYHLWLRVKTARCRVLEGKLRHS